MASLSHTLCDYLSRSNYKEAPSASMYPSSKSSNYMQDLYAIMQTLNPQIQAPPYHMNGLLKPFYYSSNVQGMSKVVGVEEDPGSLSTSWGATDQAAAPLSHRPPRESAMDQSKALNNSGSNLHVPAELHVNAAKKRVRALMDHKDVDAKCAETINGMKRLKSSACSSSNGEANDQKKELAVEVKTSNAKAQRAGGFTPKKADHAEHKSSEVKPNGKASSSPACEPSSPSKPDFIHVRARRGQATDSHSLAERVRRERISERMKYLQDLVPGCVKVTGKAMMLDEIINYVQALQRQVEFLSMKLAAVHPSKLEFSLEKLFGKKVVEHHGQSSLGKATPLTDCSGDGAGGAYSSITANETFCNSMRPHEVDASLFQTANQLPCNSVELLANLRSNLGVDNDTFMREGLAAVSSGGCGLITPAMADAMLEPTYQQTCMSQNSHSELDWDDDLQNIVQQMGCFMQTSSLCPPHSLSEGFLQATMKAEL